jgi:hypothetical protein
MNFVATGLWPVLVMLLFAKKRPAGPWLQRLRRGYKLIRKAGSPEPDWHLAFLNSWFSDSNRFLFSCFPYSSHKSAFFLLPSAFCLS